MEPENGSRKAMEANSVQGGCGSMCLSPWPEAILDRAERKCFKIIVSYQMLTGGRFIQMKSSRSGDYLRCEERKGDEDSPWHPYQHHEEGAWYKQNCIILGSYIPT